MKQKIKDKTKPLSPYEEEMRLIRKNNRYAYAAVTISAISFIIAVISLII